MTNKSPIEAIKSNNFNADYASLKLNPFKKKEQEATQAAFLAYNANPHGQVHNVTLSNGQPNSVMT